MSDPYSHLTRQIRDDLAEIARLQAENERLRIACAAGWGEPTLINMLRAENERLQGHLDSIITAHNSPDAGDGEMWYAAVVSDAINRVIDALAATAPEAPPTETD